MRAFKVVLEDGKSGKQIRLTVWSDGIGGAMNHALTVKPGYFLRSITTKGGELKNDEKSTTAPVVCDCSSDKKSRRDSILGDKFIFGPGGLPLKR